MKADVQQRLLFGGAQNDVVMAVADRQEDRPVISLGRLRHPDGFEIVIFRPFDIRRFKRDISKLEHLWIKLLTHAAFSRWVISWRTIMLGGSCDLGPSARLRKTTNII